MVVGFGISHFGPFSYFNLRVHDVRHLLRLREDTVGYESGSRVFLKPYVHFDLLMTPFVKHAEAEMHGVLYLNTFPDRDGGTDAGKRSFRRNLEPCHVSHTEEPVAACGKVGYILTGEN